MYKYHLNSKQLDNNSILVKSQLYMKFVTTIVVAMVVMMTINVLLLPSTSSTIVMASSTNVSTNKESPLLKSRRRILPSSNSGQQQWHQHHIPPSSLLPKIPLNLHQNQHQDFINDRLKVSLQCLRESFHITLNFTKPFRGVVSVGRSAYLVADDYQLAHECTVRGNGERQYQLNIPHRKCHTMFDSKCGQFSNQLFVRYHPSLETGGDYTKTLLCQFGLANFNI